MSPLRLVPPLALGAVLGVALVALCSEPPVDFPYTEPPAGDPPPEVVVPAGDVTLFGLVTDAAGVPVDGAGVSVDQRGRPFYAWTDAGGRFALEELWPGEVRVRVLALGFEATPFDGIETAGTAADAPVTLVLDRRIVPPPDPPGLRLADLEGLVRLPPRAGEPAARPYELLLTPTTAPTDPAGGFPRRVAVGPGGRFVVRLLHEGTYRATLLAAEDRGGRGPDLLAAADGTPRLVEHGADGEGTGVELVATAGAVRGRVLGSAEGDGPAPGVRGALVQAERVVGEGPDGRTLLDRAGFRAARTGDDGRFDLEDLTPGPHEITLTAGRRRRIVRVLVPERGVVELDLAPPGEEAGPR